MKTASLVARSIVTCMLSLGLAINCLASDHLDAPNLTAQGQLDINDLYAFQSPADPHNSVLVLTVNPFAGTLSPSTFGTGSVGYEFVIDNTGDTVADVTYRATFSDVAGGQTFSLMRNGVSVASGRTEMPLAVAGGGTVQAGLFDDPFFFDLEGFNNGFAFTGSDAFAGANTSGIVLEIPSSDLNGADSNIGVWARSLDGLSQVDRVGRPAINTVLLRSDRKQAFNEGAPADDAANFGGEILSAIAGLPGSSQANADALAILLPDVLTFDTSSPAGFLNGRTLSDDVIDAELSLLTGGGAGGVPAAMTDLVDANDVAFLGSFPYLAAANPIPEPSGLALILLGLPAIHVLRRRRCRS